MAINQDFIPVDTDVHFIDCTSAWKLLNHNEQLYTYYMGRASWEGAKVCAFQRYIEKFYAG